MKLWPFRKAKSSYQPRQVPTDFPHDMDDLFWIKHHALRALSGAIMDGTSQCERPHPFCGHQRRLSPQGEVAQLIVHTILQTSGDNRLFLSLFLCLATSGLDLHSEQKFEVEKYAAALTHATTTPFSKMIVSYTEGGTYMASYGEVIDPVEYDYSAGAIDPRHVESLFFDPEPTNVQHHYWESELTKDYLVMPEFHCVLIGQSWHIVDVVRVRDGEGQAGAMYQEVAMLENADNPQHSWVLTAADSQGRTDEFGKWWNNLNMNPPRF